MGSMHETPSSITGMAKKYKECTNRSSNNFVPLSTDLCHLISSCKLLILYRIYTILYTIIGSVGIYTGSIGN